MNRDFLNELRNDFTDEFIIKTFNNYLIKNKYVIEINKDLKTINSDDKLEIVQKVFFKEKYPEVYKSIFEIIISVCVATEHETIKAKDFFAFLKYNKNLELFSVKFDYYIK